MILLIDIGNTRIKWAVKEAASLGAYQARARADLSANALADVLIDSVPQPSRVLVSNVAGAKLEQELTAALRTRISAPIEFVRSMRSACGVTNAYADPGKLGTDRWMSVIAAHRGFGAACIANFGTAMTIDTVAQDGKHLGGVIVPGPQLMVTSLLEKTSDIAHHARQGDVAEDLFADNTLGAIHQGARHACAALVERAYAMSTARLGMEPTLILSGGSSEHIASVLSVPFQIVPDLVLKGLGIVSEQPAII
ncbi:MAG TPA: type III pantothenate kinase [Steroidobacteraceae bacterium]|nr:type III pantothenate kinase [Steroidobacteraceae bacterium]